MLKYKKPDNFFPNISQLESKNTEIRAKELQYAIPLIVIILS